jgi:DNA-binding MltR family transcriptional regulator
MSNRDALRKLGRKFPTPPEIEKIMNSLRKAEDISVAITATAILEAALEETLQKQFVIKKPALAGAIFQNRGPMSDFHSKILIATAFGIITPNMAEEMHSIKAIRNVFAHAKVPLTFEHEIVGREVSTLKMLTAIQRFSPEGAARLIKENRAWFLLIVKILLIILDGVQKEGKEAQQVLSDALREDSEKSA